MMYSVTRNGHSDSFHSSARPQFTVTPQDQSVLEGHTVDFPCEASGYPQPVIAWTRGGEIISHIYDSLPVKSGQHFYFVNN